VRPQLCQCARSEVVKLKDWKKNLICETDHRLGRRLVERQCTLQHGNALCVLGRSARQIARLTGDGPTRHTHRTDGIICALLVPVPVDPATDYSKEPMTLGWQTQRDGRQF
jgi:hypothetical protein